MEILRFDIAGKFAHFRKYYANNTALSYSLPPRTSVTGLLAALVGLPKDSYYREFSSEYLRVGIRIVSPIKKTFHRLNHLKVENAIDFQGGKGHTQTPFEVITGLDLRTDLVRYRIYLSVVQHSSGVASWNRIKERLAAIDPVYTLSLGVANFSAQISNFIAFPPDKWKKIGAPAGFIPIHSAVLSERVLGIDTTGNTKLLMEEELLPADFIDDYNRELSKMNRLFFAIDGQPMPLKITGDYYELQSGVDTENIVFMD